MKIRVFISSSLSRCQSQSSDCWFTFHAMDILPGVSQGYSKHFIRRSFIEGAAGISGNILLFLPLSLNGRAVAWKVVAYIGLGVRFPPQSLE